MSNSAHIFWASQNSVTHAFWSAAFRSVLGASMIVAPGLPWPGGRSVYSRKSKPLVLIVEDEPITAMGLEMDIEDKYRIAGPFSSCADALAWLETGTPELAILDAE